MKKICFALVLLMMTIFARAQSNKEDIAILQAMFGKEKKVLVSEYMTIGDSLKDKFWSLYDEYEDKRKALGRERIKLIEDYANSYATLDDKQAALLTSKKFSWTDKYNKLQQTYFSKFSSVIGARNAAKLMQLEDYLETNIRITIQEEIPFIDELDKTKLPSGSK